MREQDYDHEYNEWIHNFKKDVFPIVLGILKESGKQFIIFKSREDAWKWLESFSSSF